MIFFYLSEGTKNCKISGMAGWMTCDFTSFLTVFQSYQDDVWMIMKGCVQLNSVYGWEDFTSSEDQTRSARSVDQHLTHWATGAPSGKSQGILKWMISGNPVAVKAV